MNRGSLIAAVAAVMLPCAAFSQSHELKGRIVLTSLPAPRPPHHVTKANSACGAQLPNEALVYGKKLELENAVVFLANIKPEQLPPSAVAMEIANCLYQPRVSAVVRGDTLVLRSLDATLHHARGYLHEFTPGWDRLVTKEIFSEDAKEVFNFIFKAKGNTAWEVLNTPGLLELRSETGEDWLRAYVFVMPHRFFAISNAKGEFAFEGLPAGKYDLVLWHETLGLKRQLAEVRAKQKNEILVNWESNKPASADSLSQTVRDSSASAQK